MSTTGLVAVLSLAPGPGVPLDLVEQAHDSVTRELGSSAIQNAAARLRSVDERTGARSRFTTALQRARRLRAEFPEDALEAARETVAAGDGGFLALTDPELVAEALVLQGGLELDAGRGAGAREAFAKALDTQPGYHADPARIGPAARQALQELPRPACARLDQPAVRRAAEALGAQRVVVLQSCPEGGRVRIHATEIGAGTSPTNRTVAVALGARLGSPGARTLIGLPPDRDRPWYRRPWVWVAAGAVAAAAVAIPLATAEETGDVRVHW